MFKTSIKWEQEIPVIQQRGLAGETMTQLATSYGVTRQRMKQVIDKHIPNWKEQYGFAVHRKQAVLDHFEKWGQKENTDLYRSQREKFRAKRSNARRIGHSWDLHYGDLEWPTHCPILGIELDWFAEVRQENSPSFDQIVAGKGYIKGNVQILSWRANRIKNDGTAAEHRKVAEFLDKVCNDTIGKQENSVL